MNLNVTCLKNVRFVNFALDLTVISLMSLLFLSVEGFKVQNLNYRLTKNEIVKSHFAIGSEP